MARRAGSGSLRAPSSPHNLRWGNRPALDPGTRLAHDQRMSLTNTLYRVARASATGRAVRRGPGPVAKRVLRRRVLRVTNKATMRTLRKFGL